MTGHDSVELFAAEVRSDIPEVTSEWILGLGLGWFPGFPLWCHHYFFLIYSKLLTKTYTYTPFLVGARFDILQSLTVNNAQALPVALHHECLLSVSCFCDLTQISMKTTLVLYTLSPNWPPSYWRLFCSILIQPFSLGAASLGRTANLHWGGHNSNKLLWTAINICRNSIHCCLFLQETHQLCQQE